MGELLLNPELVYVQQGHARSCCCSMTVRDRLNVLSAQRHDSEGADVTAGTTSQPSEEPEGVCLMKSKPDHRGAREDACDFLYENVYGMQLCLQWQMYKCNGWGKASWTEGEWNVLTDRGDEQARAVSYSATKRSHRWLNIRHPSEQFCTVVNLT